MLGLGRLKPRLGLHPRRYWGSLQRFCRPLTAYRPREKVGKGDMGREGTGKRVEGKNGGKEKGIGFGLEARNGKTGGREERREGERNMVSA